MPGPILAGFDYDRLQVQTIIVPKIRMVVAFKITIIISCRLLSNDLQGLGFMSQAFPKEGLKWQILVGSSPEGSSKRPKQQR